MIQKGFTEDEVFGVLFESERERKRREMLTRVTKTVDAHRLKQMRELLMYEELAIWRRENGLDRVVEGEETCFYVHRPLPPTPEQYYTDLWSEVNALRDAISMPYQKVGRLINAIEQGKLSAEEYATLKRLVEKRVRETAQLTAVTRDDSVQHRSPCSPNPDKPSGVCFNLENEGGWTRSWRNSNHHQLVRVSTRPDSIVPQTRGYGRLEGLPPPAP